MNINDLSTEILQKIFLHLTVKQKFVCERVCRRWQQNVFYSIDKLSFEGWADKFQGRHEHVVAKQDCLPRKINANNKIMKRIILKCGKNLCSFQGYVSYALMLSIAKHCKRLHCIDMTFKEAKSLQILCDRFGNQLTCASIEVNEFYYLQPILAACPNLVSLAITSGYCFWNCSYFSTSPRQHFFIESESDSDTDDDQDDQEILPHPFTSLRNLVIKNNVANKILREITLLPSLEMLSIDLYNRFSEFTHWLSEVNSCTGLRSLILELGEVNLVNLDTLPPGLEYLELHTRRHDEEWYNDEERGHVRFSTCLPKLRTVKFYQSGMTSATLSSFIECLVRFCPNVEDLSFNVDNEIYAISQQFTINIEDELLMPLLSLSSLKRLSLGKGLIISDTFLSKLITDLPEITSLGNDSKAHLEYLLPVGELFWEALIHRALSRPCEVFDITGITKGTLYLNQPLPSNIYLDIRHHAVLNLSNGFGQSLQWQNLATGWYKLNSLTIEIQDVNCNLTGLPHSVRILAIVCRNENGGIENDALTFKTTLPHLEELTVTKYDMSNTQLGKTIESVANFFPKLSHLFIRRVIEEPEPIDEYVGRLLDCHHLHYFCFTKSCVISDEFAAKLVSRLQNLNSFGCSKHFLEFDYGSLVLKALISKAEKGVHVFLNDGPMHFEIKQKTNVSKFPRRFRVFPREFDMYRRVKKRPLIDRVASLCLTELFGGI